MATSTNANDGRIVVYLELTAEERLTRRTFRQRIFGVGAGPPLPDWVEAEIAGGYADQPMREQKERILRYLPLFSSPRRFYWNGEGVSGLNSKEKIETHYYLWPYCSLGMCKDLIYLLINDESRHRFESYEDFFEECVLCEERRTRYVGALLHVFDPGKKVPSRRREQARLFRELLGRTREDEFFLQMLRWCVKDPRPYADDWREPLRSPFMQGIHDFLEEQRREADRLRREAERSRARKERARQAREEYENSWEGRMEAERREQEERDEGRRRDLAEQDERARREASERDKGQWAEEESRLSLEQTPCTRSS